MYTVWILCALVVTFTSPVSSASSGNTGHVTSSCHMTDSVCEFWLDVSHKLTMMDRVAVFPEGGKLYNYDVTNTSAADPIDPSHVIVADGWEGQRLVIVANGTMPGPTIEVFEGQTVVVHVRNLLSSQAVTIHWHGQHQVDTPWMDGVAHVTQCPIDPLTTFTYRFKAAPKGTFWYHSHIGSQLGFGLLGALIVREKVPQVMEEFVMVVQEWSHKEDPDILHATKGRTYVGRVVEPLTFSFEGSAYNSFQFTAGLINGRGRYYRPDGSHSGAPLTKYTVEQGKQYRFRVVGASVLYPFRVSVDRHPLTIVASDGYDLEPVVAESVIVGSGERYDFLLSANQSVGTYWVRAETLQVGVSNHQALAILEYQGAGEEEPTTTRKQCASADKCVVVNCPFPFYAPGYNTQCLTVTDLRSSSGPPTPGADQSTPEPVQDVFLNFAFPGAGPAKISSVNGRQFVAPAVSALTQPQEIGKSCDPALCGEEKTCQCPYSIDLDHNKVYQFVILNTGSGRGMTHPIHMHGHSFHVLKLGFPPYNATTGMAQFGADSADINCHGNPDPRLTYCNSASWANNSWGGNDVPGLVLDRPVVKDTVTIPTGGYAVVRIRADNPGLWFMHCHVEFHATNGMGLLLNESFSRQAPPPTGFPRCGDFRLSGDLDDHVTGTPTEATGTDDDIRRIAAKLKDMDSKLDQITEDDWNISKKTLFVVLVSVGALLLLQLMILMVVVCRSSSRRG